MINPVAKKFKLKRTTVLMDPDIRCLVLKRERLHNEQEHYVYLFVLNQACPTENYHNYPYMYVYIYIYALQSCHFLSVPNHYEIIYKSRKIRMHPMRALLLLFRSLNLGKTDVSVDVSILF